MGNRVPRQESWEANERGGDYRIKYRSWRQGEPEGGPFNTPTTSTTERERAVSNAYPPLAYSIEKPKFLNSSQLEGWIPRTPVLNGVSRSHSASEKPQQNGISHGNNKSNLDHETMVFPPEVSSNNVNRDSIRAPSVNEMILQELAKAVTDELVGPEFTPVTTEDGMVGAEAIVAQQNHNSLKEEKKEEDKKVKMVVNHLYGPVHARVKEHLKSLPEWYMAKTPPQEAARHVRTLLEARRSASHQVAVSVAPQYDASQRLVPGLYVVVVCAKDRRQLLDAITRCVSQHASISEATIVTTSDGFALDRFVLSLRPDDADSTVFDDLDMFGQSLKQDIEDILAAIPASPVMSPFTNLHGKGAASKRKSGHLPPTVPENGQYTGQFEVPFQEIRLVRVLGEGRTGKTYLAEWNGQRVAAKVMSIDDSAPQTSGKKIKSNLDEFRRELHLVSKLNHPSIVRFMGASARPPRYVLLFELCEGDIGTLIRQKDRKYSFFQMALDIANGLAFLHRNDIIHRDVKPENLMLDRQGVLKVADFGLSVYASGAAAEFTAETGTYRYMAPEVMRHERYSFPADVYSFALVCYVLLTRRLPFEDLTPLQAAMAVARQDSRPKLPGNVPKPVVDLITRCWSRDPLRRPDFETVINVLEDVRQQLNNRNKKLFDWGFHDSKKKNTSSSFAAVTTALTATAI